MLLVAFIATAVFVACGDDEDEGKGGNSALVGAWIDGSGNEILVLSADGNGYWGSPKHFDDKEVFTWSATSDILTIKYPAYDNGYSSGEEEIDRYRYVVNGDKLTLSDIDDKESYSSSGSGSYSEVFTRYNLK